MRPAYLSSWTPLGVPEVHVARPGRVSGVGEIMLDRRKRIVEVM
jgi:hypothetical protein